MLKSKIFKHLTVLLAYGLIFIIISFPLIGASSSSILGSGPDPYQYIWNADVFLDEVSKGSNPFYTKRINHPIGLSLIMHTYTPIIGVVNLLLKNPYLSVNLVVFLSFVFSAFGAFLLSSKYLKSSVFAFLVGFAFAFSPYKTSHLLEHTHLLLTAAVPFFLWAILRLFDNHNFNLKQIDIRALLLMFIGFVITLLSDYYTSFALIYITVFYLLYVLIRERISKWKSSKLYLVLGGILLSTHLIVEHLSNLKFDNRAAFHNTADLLSFLIPAENSMFFNFPIAESLREVCGFKGPNEQVMFIGFSVLIGFLIFWKRKTTSKNVSSRTSEDLKIMAFLSLMFVFLSMPKIKLFGNSISYSPTSWFHYLPFLNNIRNPSRMVFMLYLFIPLLLCYRIEQSVLYDKLKYKVLIPILFLIALGFEYWPTRYPTISHENVSEASKTLSTDNNVRLIWNIPTGIADGFKEVGQFDVQLLQEQITHKKNIIGGYISRIPATTFISFEKSKVLNRANSICFGSSGSSDEDVLMTDIEEFLLSYPIDAIVFSNEQQEVRKFIEQHFATYISRIQQIDQKVVVFINRQDINL